MTACWLIIADDLTGAADCAVAFAKRGLDAAVLWGHGEDSGASVLSVDADSRHLPAAEAAARQLTAQAAHWRPGVRLYKKIDSTLRGQPAAELAAQLRARAGATRRRAPLAVVAPAFPAAGRVTLGGKVMVDDLPLERSSLWARDHAYGSAALPDVLASAGLSAQVIGLDVVRAGPASVLGRMEDAQRRGVAAVVCDGATEADLAIVATASLQLGEVVWVGSAGLAAALAAAMPLTTRSLHPKPAALSRPILTVVGSLAESSRRQAQMLAQSGQVTCVVVTPEILLAGPRAPGYQAATKALSDGFAVGADMLLVIGLSENPHLARGAELAASLAGLVAGVAPEVGALVVTGGQIARSVLSRLGVHGIRLVDEVEPGVPLGMTLGALAIPVVTKAGAFGDADTLRRCLVRLKNGPTGVVTTQDP